MLVYGFVSDSKIDRNKKNRKSTKREGKKHQTVCPIVRFYWFWFMFLLYDLDSIWKFTCRCRFLLLLLDLCIYVCVWVCLCVCVYFSIYFIGNDCCWLLHKCIICVLFLFNANCSIV